MSLDYLRNDEEKIEYIKSLLISRATGKDANPKEYQKLRGEFLLNKSIEPLLPSWIRTTRDLDSFWTFIKGKYDTYQERRDFVHREFSEILDFLELGILPEVKSIMKNEVLLGKGKNKVFIVHGRDETSKIEVAGFVESFRVRSYNIT